MENKYLGEKTVKIEDSPYSKYEKGDWAMYFLERYGQIDGSHHKLWVLDQIARVMHGTPIIIRLAKWDNGQSEYRIETGKPSKEYRGWVKEMKGKYIRTADYNGYEYSYDVGIPP